LEAANSSNSHAASDEPKRLEVGELVRLCEEVVRTFNPGRTTVDTHTEEYVAANKVHDADDVRFIQQVMYGCVRYKRLLKIFISSLYFRHGGESQRSDAQLYTIFGYLAMLRLAELGFADFKALVQSQESHAMSVFLKFLFNEENLQTWLRPEWLKCYEPAFVDDTLVAKPLVFKPQVETLLKSLEGAIAAEVAKKEAATAAVKLLGEGKGGRGEFTVAEPFNLHEPKMRTVPMPEEAVDVGFKAVPIPASTYLDPKKQKDRVELDRRKDANRLEMKAKYADPSVQPFKLKTLERPTTLEKVKAQVEASRDAECDFDRRNAPRAVPPPRSKPGSGNVRLNAAAIMREDNLYRKKQEAEAAKLRNYEAELRDASEFDEWQAKMKRRDGDAETEKLERLRMETMLTDEAAKEAKLRVLNEARAAANATKMESNEGLVHQIKESQQVRAAQRALVQDVHSQRERPALAMEEVRMANRANAELMREAQERHAEAIAEERRAEEIRRADLIRQIRALELVPKKRVVALDPTYVPNNVGVLEQMSLAELRERLVIVEDERKAEEEKRRRAIVSAKRDKEEDLKGRVVRLSAIRDLAAQDGARRLEASRRAVYI